MKKLKLEELEVKSLTTSLQDESAEVKGGTSGLCVTVFISIVVATAAMSTPAY